MTETIQFKLNGQHVEVTLDPIPDTTALQRHIDKVLAKHYGFTEEGLDFIINHDIKYRVGMELGAGE